MPREEHILGSSSYSGGAGGGGSGCSSNSRSKKIKQKKVPQRGLGVAQLEKIRLEEQQKKQSVQAVQAANILAKNAICSSTNSNNNNNNININNNNNSPPFLAAQCSNFRPPFHNSAPLPPPPPPPSSPPRTNLPSPKAFYNRHENSVRISKNEKQGFVDSRGFSFEPQVNLPYDPSVLPLPINSRSHQIHRSCSSSSSMVNLNSTSIELNSPMEPPSNQSFRSNNYVPSWTDDDKIIGMKRSYPFSLESPPLSQCNFHPKNYSSVSKSDELLASSIDNRYTANIEPRSKCIIREGNLNSNPLPGRNMREVNQKNERLNGDFLTLAPPNLNSKHGLFEYESIPVEEYSKSSDSFSFFPIKLPNDETTRHLSIGSNNGEKGETIDLNLKL